MTKRQGKKRGAGMLPNGRSASKPVRYLNITRDMLISKRFRHLSGSAIKVLFALCTRHTGFNNRRISCSCRELQTSLKMGKATALKALAELEKAGFIVCVKKGYFVGRKASEWEITFLHSDGYEPTHLWKDHEQRPKRPYLEPTRRNLIEDMLNSPEYKPENKT